MQPAGEASVFHVAMDPAVSPGHLFDGEPCPCGPVTTRAWDGTVMVKVLLHSPWPQEAGGMPVPA